MRWLQVNLRHGAVHLIDFYGYIPWFEKCSLNLFALTYFKLLTALGRFRILLPEAARTIYEVESVKKLYAEKDQFDLMIISGIINEVCFIIFF